jgi:hypothetical protein
MAKVRSAVILDIKSFRLNAGSDEAAFLKADERLRREFTYKQPGILRCTTAKGGDGEWLVLLLWASMEAADGPSGGSGKPVVEAWLDFIDQSTARIERFEAVDR